MHACLLIGLAYLSEYRNSNSQGNGKEHNKGYCMRVGGKLASAFLSGRLPNGLQFPGDREDSAVTPNILALRDHADQRKAIVLEFRQYLTESEPERRKGAAINGVVNNDSHGNYIIHGLDVVEKLYVDGRDSTFANRFVNRGADRFTNSVFV
jgi:hypothetical protein